MKILSRFLIPGSLLLLSGCSMLGQGGTSNVMQIGKDSFTVRAISPRSTSEAKQKALAAANAYCKAQGNRSVMLVKEFSGVENETNEKFDDLTFLCLSQGDHDFTRIKRDSITPDTLTPPADTPTSY